MAPAIRFVVGDWHVAISTHGAFVIVAAIVGTLVAVRRARTPTLVLAWAPLLVVAVLAGASALFRATHGWQGGGLSSMGGVVALLAGAAMAARTSGQRFAGMADALAPAGLVALGLGRVGCFLAGCCYGRPTDLPWGVVSPEVDTLARHPLPLYAGVFDLVLAAALVRTAGPPGTLAARAAVGFGAGRLALESLRDPAAADRLLAGLGTAQAGALLVLAGGIAATLRRRRQ
jgi:prolipoprotein diacylglyceryltransferase